MGIGMIIFAYQHQHDQVDGKVKEYYGTHPNQHGLGWVIFNALQQGVGGAILYGKLNQLASFVGSLHHSNSNTNSTINDAENENEALPKKFKATVSAGIEASAMVVLGVSWGSGFGTMNASNFPKFLLWIVYAELFCFVASVWLLVARPRIQASMIRRDSSMMLLPSNTNNNNATTTNGTVESSSSTVHREFNNELFPVASTFSSLEHCVGVEGDETEDEQHDPMRRPLLVPPLFPSQQQEWRRRQERGVRETPPSSGLLLLNRFSVSNGSSSGSSVSSGSSSSLEMSMLELVYYSRYCFLGLALTLIPSFLIESWFTHVQTNWMLLAQILFYTSIGSALIGRFVTIVVPPNSIHCVVWMAGLRNIAVVVFFLNSSQQIPTYIIQTDRQRDAVSIGLVVFISFCSGYNVTSCYQLAPQQLIPNDVEIRNANATKQNSILTVAFSVSAICGLLLSFLFIAIGV